MIVGGLAAGAHGVVRATRDLDLVPDPDPANLNRLAATLKDLGGEHPSPERLQGDALSRPASMKIATSCGENHVLNRMPGTMPFGEFAAERLLVEIDPDVLAPVARSATSAP